LLLESNSSHAIIVDNLKKVYPGMDGNPAKFAVRGLSLTLPQGECFGMLGPNGAGKTSFINMVSTKCSFSLQIIYNTENTSSHVFSKKRSSRLHISP
jgi:ABC-type multidrug transport system ATPase subunit